MSKAPPPSDGPAPAISADMLSKVKNMTAPAGPAPSLPPSLLARASNRLKISREEVAGNDESFMSGAESPQDSPLKVDLGDDDDDDDDDHNGEYAAADRSYERDGRYDDSRDDYDRRYDDEDRRSNRDDDRYDDRDRGYDRDRDYDGRDRDRNSERDRDVDRGYDSRDGDGYSRHRDRERGERRRYDSDEGDDYSGDDEPRDSGTGRDTHDTRAAQPKSATIDLTRGDPYSYTSTSRVPTTSEKPTIFNFRPILKATYRELRNFVLSPVQPGQVVRCYIERNRQGSNAFAPYYSLCADLEDGTGRELMMCRKVFYSSKSHYVFSLKADDLYRKREQRSRLYLGKLRATGKDSYVLYDNGNVAIPESKADAKGGDLSDDDDEAASAKAEAKGTIGDDASLYRKELALLVNNTKKRPAPPGIRGTELSIPSTYLNAEEQLMRRNNSVGALLPDTSAQAKGAAHHVSTVPPAPSSSMMLPFTKVRSAGKQNVKQTNKIFVMHERTSKYDALSSCLVDFKGRANIPSVKNFQLVESSPQDGAKDEIVDDQDKDFLLQMGKTTEDCFNMDTRYPLCLLQAFATCIARFDSGLSW